MAITQHWTVIGIFDTQEQARQAMTDLQQAGFQDDQIGGSGSIQKDGSDQRKPLPPIEGKKRFDRNQLFL